MSLLFNQVTLDITDYDGSLDNLYSIPYLGGNLKQSIQPEWSDNNFLRQLDNLHIQMLRWPGAEAMNYFDWTRGAFMPCYKWAYAPCYPQDCLHLDEDVANIDEFLGWCNSEYLCFDNGVGVTSRTIQSSLLGSSNSECKRNKNFTDNYASHYMNAINNEVDRKLIPFFGLNIVDPGYYNPTEYVVYDEYYLPGGECSFPDNPIEYNTIEAQLDTIAALASLYGISSNDIHIQLTNEPWIESHSYLPWRNNDGSISVDEYGAYVVDALNRIRNHSSSIIHNAKVGVFVDILKSFVAIYSQKEFFLIGKEDPYNFSL